MKDTTSFCQLVILPRFLLRLLLLLCCVPFSPCHCHGEILAFASTVLLGSWYVTTTTRLLFHVPSHHLWNQFHLYSFVATENAATTRVQLDFDFSLLEMRVLILAQCTWPLSQNCQCLFHQDKAPALSDQHRHWPLGHHWDLADHKRNLRRSCQYDPSRVSPFRNLEHGGEGREWAWLNIPKLMQLN